MESCQDVVIVGAGISGLATAIALKRVGIKAIVLERAPELRETGAAISLFHNAWRALNALGVSHKFTSIYSPVQKGFVANLSTGSVQQLSFPITRDSEGNEIGLTSLHRKVLLKSLAEELPDESIRFNSKLESFTVETIENTPIYVLHLGNGDTMKTRVLIGCDGVHSVVSHWLGLTAPVHSGRSGVRALSAFPQGHGLEHQVHQYVKEDIRAGIVPLNRTDVYWFVTFSEKRCQGEEWGNRNDPEKIVKEVLYQMCKDFPDTYLEMVRHSDLETVTLAPLMFRLPWDVIIGSTYKGAVTIAGDAFHPMTPDLGQGGCLALEDSIVLGKHIGKSFIKSGRIEKESIEKAVESYVKERRWRTGSLIVGAYLSGWMQQGSSGWLRNFIRGYIFYGLIFNKLFNAVHYDCGKLPSVPPHRMPKK